MSVEQQIAEAVHPRAPLADLAVGQRREMAPEWRAERAHDLLDGVERNAADQKQLIAHCQPPHNLRLAICAPCTIALSFAQATSGWTSSPAPEVPKPQSVPAITRSRPTTSANRTIRCATSSG